MLTTIQCIDCKLFPSVKLSFDKDLNGGYTCSEYPKGIPTTVDNGTEDCPKFKEKE